jgi:hypothetical protein
MPVIIPDQMVMYDKTRQKIPQKNAVKDVATG